MRLVVDANILLAALIRDSATRRLLLRPDLSLFGPYSLYSEVLEHAINDPEIRTKTNLSSSDLVAVFELVCSRIVFVQKEKYSGDFEPALKLAPHAEDAPYLALALHLGCPVWSNDAGLSRQAKVTVIDTSALVRLLRV